MAPARFAVPLIGGGAGRSYGLLVAVKDSRYLVEND